MKHHFAYSLPFPHPSSLFFLSLWNGVFILISNLFSWHWNSLLGWGLIAWTILHQLNQWRHWFKNRHHGLILTDYNLITPFGLNTAALLTIPYQEIGRVKIYTNAQNEPRSVWLTCGKHGFIYLNRPFPELPRFISLLQEKIPDERFESQLEQNNYIPILVGIAVIVGAILAGTADSRLLLGLVGLGTVLLASFYFIPQKYYAQPSWFENPAGTAPGESVLRGVGYLIFLGMIGALFNEWAKQPCVWWNQYIHHSPCVYQLPAGEWAQFTADEQHLYVKEDDTLTRYPLSHWPTWRIDPTLTGLPTLNNRQLLLPDGVTYLQVTDSESQQWNLPTGQLENTAVITATSPTLSPAGNFALDKYNNRLFNPRTGELQKQLLPGRWFLGTANIWAQLEETPNQLVSWQLPAFSAQYALPLPPEIKDVYCLTSSADDQTVVITPYHADPLVWQAAGQTFTPIPLGLTYFNCQMALSPDGTWLVLADHNQEGEQLWVWSTTTNTAAWSWPMEKVRYLTFSPSGRYVAVNTLFQTFVLDTHQLTP